MFRKKERALVVTILLVLVQFFSALYMIGYFMQPVVICFSDDNITKETAMYLSESLDNCPIIETDSIQELMRTTMYTLDAVFYVGHGSKEGIESKSSMIEWNFIERAITQSPSNEHMILACNSEINIEETTKTCISFPGSIDARIASDITLALHYLKDGDSTLSNSYGQLATLGYFSKVLLGTEKQEYLGVVYDDGGGGTGDDWDFYHQGVFYDSYSVDPSEEVYYDHPSYATYYRLMGVGAPNTFTVGYSWGIWVDHISRATVDLWKLGGLFAMAELLVAIGIAAALTIWGLEVAPIILAFAALLGVLGWTASAITEILIEDELGAGWIFYESVSGGFRIKLGMSWWFFLSNVGGIIPLPCDGHYLLY
ncbi:MAG: hypothetical protein ACTSUO_08190 [Candidatus Thorarchaeota archaeon]